MSCWLPCDGAKSRREPLARPVATSTHSLKPGYEHTMLIESLLAAVIASADAEPDRIEVRGRDIDATASESTARLDEEAIALIRPTHPSEIFARLPGTWVTRGSGQEHLSAVRSPLLAGAGACGALLLLEDGIPVRPPGFCNVNGFFEINLLQADSVNVLRGPGGIGHASGGLHGVVDVRTRSPLVNPLNEVRMEAGSDDFYRLGVSLTENVGEGALGLDAQFTDSGSFRQDEGYDHQFVTLNHVVPIENGQWRTTLSAARLDQDTAGFIIGRDSFRAPDLRRENLNPEAFRQGTAVRLLSRGEWVDAQGNETRLSAYARRSRMTFLQHFLPGQPLERNGQVSSGLQLDQTRFGEVVDWDWGVDVEWFKGFLFQSQAAPAVGTPFLVATRPVGRHYDYEVTGQRLGGYVAGTFEWANDWSLRAGLNADYIRYQYDNAMEPGNLTDAGEPCGFGGCLYTRPDDRRDDFLDFAPEVTLTRRFDQAQAWLRVARGYRAPQATELYRLQSGQSVADLDSERLDSVELGVRGGTADGLRWEAVAFVQRKENFIFRDAVGFNVSDGRTRGQGIELAADYAISPSLSLAGRGTWAIHEYRFDRDLGGEQIIAGLDIPSAPRRVYSTDLTWRPDHRWLAQLAFESTGPYWLDAANERRYEGHRLWHAYAERRFDDGWVAGVRVRNLLDRRYAERADFAFGDFRYFPGPGRSLFVNLARQW